MRIKKISYTDKTTGWELKSVSFNQLTLLVGASGVGKTRILNSILDLKRIAAGDSLIGVKWHIEFLSSSGTQYTWEGEFENSGVSTIRSLLGDLDIGGASILSELVYRENELIVERNNSDIIFNKIKTVRLSADQSVLHLLREEEQIKEAASEFKKIIFYNTERHDFYRHFRSLKSLDEKINRYDDIEEVRNLSLSLTEKLYFVYKRKRQLFDDIASSFIDIFPHVEDVQVVSILTEIPMKNAPEAILIQIQIKEKYASDWIDEYGISSGMLKTLVYIAQLQLCADSSLILIDEFENSLGINCIDELTSSIVSAERGLQFIITSHHPYIINNIKHTDWKIVTRKGGAVIAHDASAFNFDKSKHKAFTQLINLDLYSEGVES
ncbi:AAA domain-containing protein, putative AbiEii toxin, Type IV TA system [Candidatus Electrothrix aarhusensis]|uniref:AAA domain-containing protein, putative AbiEii toxin, Type IV TA system n=1 Tax=Candidatus Electrothrix aarhusensis TaxID=1859131 RepID=A0A444IU59_9BACT|nr:AAA domain-containing protein, putative AbiEii toxin, Type IV TA system [Candidatus Electrothrix aarhusensis]